jgi:KUP system potassium uptake protein
VIDEVMGMIVTLIAIAVPHIIEHPAILQAVWPGYAVQYFTAHGLHGVIVLGAVFLVVTGGEALYADMGHFGAKPVRLAWVVVVLPALLVNYFGQAAFLLEHPEGLAHPVMHMSPGWARIPVLVISTAATIIASQALISGTYSITRQAILLGFAPRYSNRDALIRNYDWYFANLSRFEGASGVSHRVPWSQGILQVAKRFF